MALVHPEERIVKGKDRGSMTKMNKIITLLDYPRVLDLWTIFELKMFLERVKTTATITVEGLMVESNMQSFG